MCSLFRLFAYKIDPGHPSSTWFLEPTRAHNPNGISIGSAVFAGLTTVTDRPTDCGTAQAGYLVRSNSTAMRPKTADCRLFYP